MTCYITYSVANPSLWPSCTNKTARCDSETLPKYSAVDIKEHATSSFANGPTQLFTSPALICCHRDPASSGGGKILDCLNPITSFDARISYGGWSFRFCKLKEVEKEMILLAWKRHSALFVGFDNFLWNFIINCVTPHWLFWQNCNFTFISVFL